MLTNVLQHFLHFATDFLQPAAGTIRRHRACQMIQSFGNAIGFHSSFLQLCIIKRIIRNEDHLNMCHTRNPVIRINKLLSNRRKANALIAEDVKKQVAAELVYRMYKYGGEANSFDPIVPEELTEEQQDYILGVQANLWTEQVAWPEHAFYQLLPRLASMSEVQWCKPEKKDFPWFLRRKQDSDRERRRSENALQVSYFFAIPFAAVSKDLYTTEAISIVYQMKLECKKGLYFCALRLKRLYFYVVTACTCVTIKMLYTSV